MAAAMRTRSVVKGTTNEAGARAREPIASTSHGQERAVLDDLFVEDEVTFGTPPPTRQPEASTSYRQHGSKGPRIAIEEAIAAAPPPPPHSITTPSLYEDGSIIPIRELLGNGISEADIENLKRGGYYTVNGIAFALKKKLMQVKGLSEKKVEKVLSEAHKRIRMGFSTASYVLRKLDESIKIKTGVRSLDDLLLGGFQTGQITELYSASRCGKSQICHVLAVTCQLPVDQGGAEAKAIYLDTQKTFRSQRIISIAEYFNLDPATVLDNISVAQARSIDHQYQLLVYARAMLSESRYGIVIVDAVTHLYRGEFSGGLSELSARQQHLAKFLRGLKDIADEFSVAVVICNQIVANVSGANSFFHEPYVASGGDFLAHFCKNRLELKKGRGPNRICKVINSPNLPTGEAFFSITANGIGDAVTD